MILVLLLAIFTALGLALVLCNTLIWAKVGATDGATLPPLAVLIPARNEEANLAACLDAVLTQGASVCEVWVCDDHSTDRTAEIVLHYAERDGRVGLLTGEALPAGWCGKNFACWQLAQTASAEWLLFLDADARLQPQAAARLLAEARRRDLTLLSAWPHLVTGSFWERVLMPLLNLVVFSLFPAAFSDNRDARLALAHGACILAHRPTYLQVGGHEAVRAEIFEDVRLAERWRQRQQRGLCLDGGDVVRVRMYEGFGDIWRGFQKNFYPAFRRQSSFWMFLLLHFTLWLLPFLLLPLAVLAMLPPALLLVSVGNILAARLLLAWRFRQPYWAMLLHPLAEAVLLALGISSWWRCQSGAGVVWKGRAYRGEKR